MVIVYKAPVSLTSVFKPCQFPDLERADLGRESFQYTWLNSYFFSSLREPIRPNILSYQELLASCDIVRSLLQQLSLLLRYLVSLDTALWYRATSIITLSIPAISPRGVTTNPPLRCEIEPLNLHFFLLPLSPKLYHCCSLLAFCFVWGRVKVIGKLRSCMSM